MVNQLGALHSLIAQHFTNKVSPAGADVLAKQFTVAVEQESGHFADFEFGEKFLAGLVLFAVQFGKHYGV